MSGPTASDQAAADVAAEFAYHYERAWNGHGPAAAQLYTAEAMLIGQSVTVGRPGIARLLAALYEQGWTKIAITVVHAHSVGGVVLAACEFSASGSGHVAGQTLNGHSSQVLTHVGGQWLSAMHCAS